MPIVTVEAPYIGNLTFHCHPDHIYNVMKSSKTVYEADLLQYIAETVPREGIWIDAGACIGTHSVFFATLGVDVFAYEPILENYALLEKNVQQVQEGGVIHYAQRGLGAFSATAYGDRQSENMGMCRLVLADYEAPIDIVAFDSLLPEIGFLTGGNPITLMKIDVEGMELDVLQGARETLRHWHPRLFVEVRAENLQAVDAFLAEYGYQRGKRFCVTPVYEFS